MNDSTAATHPANDSSVAKPAHGSPVAQPDHLIVSVLRLHCPQCALSSDCLKFTRNASLIEFNDDSANCLYFYYVLKMKFVVVQQL